MLLMTCRPSSVPAIAASRRRLCVHRLPHWFDLRAPCGGSSQGHHEGMPVAGDGPSSVISRPTYGAASETATGWPR